MVQRVERKKNDPPTPLPKGGEEKGPFPRGEKKRSFTKGEISVPVLGFIKIRAINRNNAYISQQHLSSEECEVVILHRNHWEARG